MKIEAEQKRLNKEINLLERELFEKEKQKLQVGQWYKVDETYLYVVKSLKRKKYTYHTVYQVSGCESDIKRVRVSVVRFKAVDLIDTEFVPIDRLQMLVQDNYDVDKIKTIGKRIQSYVVGTLPTTKNIVYDWWKKNNTEILELKEIQP